MQQMRMCLEEFFCCEWRADGDLVVYVPDVVAGVDYEQAVEF